MADILTIALAKGRLGLDALDLLETCGIDGAELRTDTRKLVLEDPGSNTRFIWVKPADVPTYVAHGVADMGVVGKDTLMEENQPLYEMLDLGYGKCRLCIAGFPDQQRQVTGRARRVATKYPNIARAFYAQRGESIEVIKLNGSVELGPIVGLSDEILDIVESGKTLVANGLAVLEEICPVSARLVVNRVSLKLKSARIRPLIAQMETVLAKG